MSKHLVILFWSKNAGNSNSALTSDSMCLMDVRFHLGRRNCVVPVFITRYAHTHTHACKGKHAGAHGPRSRKTCTATFVRSMCRSNRFNHKVRYANDGCVSVWVCLRIKLRQIDCFELKTEKSTMQSTCALHGFTGLMRRNILSSIDRQCNRTAYSAFFPLRLLFVVLVPSFVGFETGVSLSFVRIN